MLIYCVLGLSIALFASVALLASEAHKRILAEWMSQVNKGVIAELRDSLKDTNSRLNATRAELRQAQTDAAKTAIASSELLDAARMQERRRFDQREALLVGQVQAMAERLATLKIKWHDEDDSEGKMTLEEDVVVGADLTNLEQPYAPALSDFISALESEDAREMVETYVESRRAEGKIDEQILEMLERGEY